MPRARKMLSDWDATYIKSLVKLIETQNKSTLAHWTVDYAERFILPLWNKHYPDDRRPRNALNAAHEWLSGTIKLPQTSADVCLTHCVPWPLMMSRTQPKSTGSTD